jgi:hypothetical protein
VFAEALDDGLERRVGFEVHQCSQAARGADVTRREHVETA